MERKEAKQHGDKHYNTGRPCKHGHVSDRDTRTGKCLRCHSLAETKRNRDAGQEYRDRQRAYYEADRPRRLANATAWRRANPRRRSEAEFKRRALKSRAMPTWLTIEQLDRIKEIYRSCPGGYEVDHRIPLNSKVVCGLHVPWNLKAIPAEENRRKRNKVCQELALSILEE